MLLFSIFTVVYVLREKLLKVSNLFLFFSELLDNLRPVSPKPGHLERVKTPQNSTTAMDEDEPYKERFLKINVRHITDGQVNV